MKKVVFMNEISFKVIALLSAVLLFGGVVYAQATEVVGSMESNYFDEAKLEGNAHIPEVLQKVLKNSQDKVHKSFYTDSGLTGWVVIFEEMGAGSPVVFYTTPDANHLIAGELYTASEEKESLIELNAAYIKEHGPEIDLNGVWENLAKNSTWISEKSEQASKSLIYVFADMNCVFCYYAHKALKPYVAAGLEVRWVPVGILSEDSLLKASQLLTSSNPVQDIDTYYDKFNDDDMSKGKIAALLNEKAINDDLVRKLNINAKFMRDLGSRGTPAVVYQDGKGETRVQNGMFMLEQIPYMTGLELIENTDESLKRFQSE